MEFLDTAEQKLKREDITASDAADLAQQLDKHKVSLTPSKLPADWSKRQFYYLFNQLEKV